MTADKFPRRIHHCGPWLLVCLLICAAGCAKEEPQPVDPSETPAGGLDTKRSEEGPNGVVDSTQPLGLLVSVERLREISGREKLRILDVRTSAEFDAGHIPAAVAVDVNAWKALTLKEDGAGLHDADAWAQTIGAVGIDNGTQVVVYSNSPTSAARVWWILKYVGVKSASLLDGGWAAWRDSGAEVSTEVSEFEPAEFTVEFQEDRLSLIGDLKQNHSADSLVVVDARSRGEFAGEGAAKGRIPGAAHLEWKELLDDKNFFKPKEELKKLFAAHGITPDKTAVTHCQTGGRASVNVFALELAGYGKVKNYYCGWSEWSKDDQAPREQGEP